MIVLEKTLKSHLLDWEIPDIVVIVFEGMFVESFQFQAPEEIQVFHFLQILIIASNI